MPHSMYRQQPELQIVDGNRATAEQEATAGPSTNPAVVVASGKGGVGKTMLSTNLSVALCGLGRRVLLVDTNLGLGGSHHLLGVRPRHSLAEFVRTGDPELAVCKAGNGLMLAPAGAGREELANADELTRARVLQSLGHFDDRTDMLVLDTPAGISRAVTQVTTMAERVLVVATTERTALADAYALLKAIARRRRQPTVSLMFNQVQSTAELRLAAQRLEESAARFLKLRTTLIGWVPADPAVPRSVARQVPLVRSEPYSPAARAIRAIARRLNTDPLLAPPMRRSRVDHAGLKRAS